MTSEKNPPIRARPAVFQKWEDHWIKVRKEAKWGDCPRTSLYISTTKECQKNLLIRLTDFFWQIKERIDIITGKLIMQYVFHISRNSLKFMSLVSSMPIHLERLTNWRVDCRRDFVGYYLGWAMVIFFFRLEYLSSYENPFYSQNWRECMIQIT